MERAIEKMKIVIPVTLLTDLPAAVSELPAHHRNTDRDAVGALRAGRRRVADVVARLQPVGGGGSGLHRLAGVAAETGVVMLIYLDHAWEAVRATCRTEGRVPGPFATSMAR
jgi:Cu(I)/Ag(I) efflux system membrane protein CusA/SilA